MSLTRVRAVSLPVWVLVLVSVLSLGARVAWLGSPCHSPCSRPSDHLLIFDETYYVNAARVIAGIHPPAGAHYASAPLGDDPNSEHPQLAKLVIAGSIELFGDGPLAWRLGSLLAGSLAILGMWALARSAGAGQWPAAGAATLMAADNLLLVAGRIGTLDIYAVAAMVWGVALYLKGRPVVGGLVLAAGMAAKEVSLYALAVLAILELMQVVAGSGARPSWRPAAAAATRRLGDCAVWALGGLVGLLALMDRIAPPYDPGTHRLLAGGVLGQIGHIVSYGASLSSPHGPRGIASYPWEWLGDYKPIVYLSIDPARPSPGLRHDHPISLFLGMVSPPILLLALPALAYAAIVLARRRSPAMLDDRFAVGRCGPLGLAWFLGTFVPFEALSLIWNRTSYLYYMVVVMPGLYLAVIALVVRLREHRLMTAAWWAAVIIAAVVMYPFMPLL